MLQKKVASLEAFWFTVIAAKNSHKYDINFILRNNFIDLNFCLVARNEEKWVFSSWKWGVD